MKQLHREDNTEQTFRKHMVTLTLLKVKFYSKQIGMIALVSALFVGLLLINGIATLVLTNVDVRSRYTLVGWLITLMSLVFFIFTVVFTFKVFKDEVMNNVHSLELRYGFKPRELYLSRVTFSVSLISILFLLVILVNLAFGLPNINDTFMYQMFLTSLGWYFMVIMCTFTLTIFFTVFFNQIWSIVLTVLIFLFMTFTSVFSGAFFLGVNDTLRTTYKIQADFTVSEAFDNIDSKMRVDYAQFKEQLGDPWIKFKEDEENKGNHVNLDQNILFNNINFFGIKGWENWQTISNDPTTNLEIIAIYNYFNNYFELHKFNYDYSNVTGLGDDSFQNREEPIFDFLTQMGKTVDKKYANLIATLSSLTKDPAALRIIYGSGENAFFNWFTTSRWINNDQLAELTTFINNHKITAPELIFYKMLGTYWNEVENLPTNSETAVLPEQIEKQLDEKVINSTNISKNQLNKLYWNPFAQFSALFSGVNYNNPYLSTNIQTGTNTFTGPLNYGFDIHKVSASDGSNKVWYEANSNPPRIIYPEVIYVVYTIISGLIIFACYFKFKKNLISK